MSEKKSTQIYEDLKQDILSGKIDSRSFLNASEISKQYQVSKAPVRDALQVLCAKGFLVSYPRKGYMVNLFTNEEANKIQSLRRHIEQYSVRKAIENATDEEIHSLEVFCQNPNVSTEPEESNNMQFHLRLAEISHNEYLPEVIRDLVGKITLANIKSESDLNSHQKIIDALLQRDLNAAIEYINDDIHPL